MVLSELGLVDGRLPARTHRAAVMPGNVSFWGQTGHRRRICQSVNFDPEET